MMPPMVARRALALFALLGACSCNAVFGIERGKAREETPPLAGGPAIYASRQELALVKAKVDLGAEPWASAYPAFEADVSAALDLTPVSVVDDGGPADGGDLHLFATDSSTGGCSEPERHDYCAAQTMSKAARDLALSYVLTGDQAHAAKAVALLFHWFVAPETRMLPEAGNAGPRTSGQNSGGDIEVDLVVPPFLYAASFLRGHPHWKTLSDSAEADFLTWVSDFLSDARQSTPSMGSGSRFAYHLAAMAAAEALLEDPLAASFADWKAFMASGVDAGGIVVGTSSVSDAWFTLKGMVLTAQLASYYHDDLYAFDDGGGSPLERAFDAYAGCAAMGSCPFSETLDGGTLAEGASVYELAYSRYQTPAHLGVIEAAVRPILDDRILGWTTLTHSNRFELGLPP
jgi:hypothetical protein